MTEIPESDCITGLLRMDLLSECERHPDKWFRIEARRKYDFNLSRVAHFLGSNPQNLVFVENPTTGINAVMNSLEFDSTDTILMYNHTYNAVKNIVKCTADKTGAKIHVVDLPLPLTTEEDLVQVITQKKIICHVIKKLLGFCRKMS